MKIPKELRAEWEAILARDRLSEADLVRQERKERKIKQRLRECRDAGTLPTWAERFAPKH